MTELRIDKWLWAARFFKTRSLCTTAVKGGKVHVDGERVKPSRRIVVGQKLLINRGAMTWEIIVTAISKQRKPAPEAQLLYQETEASLTNRTSQVAREDQARRRDSKKQGRPDKRARRNLRNAKGKW